MFIIIFITETHLQKEHLGSLGGLLKTLKQCLSIRLTCLKATCALNGDLEHGDRLIQISWWHLTWLVPAS